VIARDIEQLEAFRAYIAANPVKAKLSAVSISYAELNML
jgi:hypothetical protein